MRRTHFTTSWLLTQKISPCSRFNPIQKENRTLTILNVARSRRLKMFENRCKKRIWIFQRPSGAKRKWKWSQKTIRWLFNRLKLRLRWNEKATTTEVSERRNSSLTNPGAWTSQKLWAAKASCQSQMIAENRSNPSSPDEKRWKRQMLKCVVNTSGTLFSVYSVFNWASFTLVWFYELLSSDFFI